jgi:hypothetical protein
MALRWHNLPCALMAAIGIGKRTLGDPGQSDPPRGPQQGPRPEDRAPTRCPSGAADSLHEAKAAFRAAWERAFDPVECAGRSDFGRRRRLRLPSDGAVPPPFQRSSFGFHSRACLCASAI